MERLTNKTGRMSVIIRACLISVVPALFSLTSCHKDEADFSYVPGSDEPFDNPQYNISQSVSDEAQQNTISFDALGFMNGNFGAQTFLPPGKVADYCGFQYFRDNDQTNLGHNTSFVTIIANNILNILDDAQINMYISAAREQVELINEYAYKRFPLCMAFRRLIDGDLPSGTTGLDEEAVESFSAALYRIDGRISYNRATLFSKVINSLSVEQKKEILALKDLKGVGNWPADLQDKLGGFHLDQDVSVVVMTYASEMYSWFAGSVTADVYFCPERQGTYFGSFYLKDWPAMGNPNYTINEQLTASAGQDLLNILTTDQKNLITGIVALQKESLTALVETRKSVSTELRKYLAGGSADSTAIGTLSEQYGRYDGKIIYLYATYFSRVYKSLSSAQKSSVENLGADLGYIDPSGAFLYSAPIPMPSVPETDFLFK